MSDASLLKAILAVQKEAPTLPKDKTNPHFGSKYTPLDTIVEKVGPVLNKHGLVWLTLPSGTHEEPALAYRLVHAVSGDEITGLMPLLLDKSSAQAFGSAITYARRYALCAVLNLIADDDDDGQAADSRQQSTARVGTGKGFASDKQKQTIEKLLKEKGATLEQLTIMLDTIGAQVEPTPGWIGRLSGGREGSASALLSWLMERPLPSTEHPTDAPADDEGFVHPEDDGKGTPMELHG